MSVITETTLRRYTKYIFPEPYIQTFCSDLLIPLYVMEA